MQAFTTTVRLVKLVANSFTTVFSKTLGFNIANGDELMVIFAGSTISVYLNRSFIGSTTDSFNSTATNYGVQGGSNLTSLKHLYDLQL